MGLFDGWVIVSDIDGTLLPYGAMCPSDECKAAVEKWRSEGGSFVLASGRYLQSTLKIYQGLNLDTPLIYNNGACVYSPASNNFPSLKVLGKGIRDFINAVLSIVPDCGIAGYGKDAIYTVRENPVLLCHYQRQSIQPLQTEDYSQFCKVLITVEAPEMEKLKEQLSKMPRFSEYQFAQSTPEFYEITAKGVTKACQLDLICSLLNTSKDKLITVGDNENDIDMLKNRNYSFAVANAVDTAKVAARFTTVARGDSGSAIAEVVEFLAKQFQGR